MFPFKNSLADVSMKMARDHERMMKMIRPYEDILSKSLILDASRIVDQTHQLQKALDSLNSIKFRPIKTKYSNALDEHIAATQKRIDANTARIENIREEQPAPPPLQDHGGTPDGMMLLSESLKEQNEILREQLDVLKEANRQTAESSQKANLIARKANKIAKQSLESALAANKLVEEANKIATQSLAEAQGANNISELALAEARLANKIAVGANTRSTVTMGVMIVCALISLPSFLSLISSLISAGRGWFGL